MYKSLWDSIHPSICSITLLNGTNRISSGSAFKINDYLITNNHVIQVPSTSHFQLSFVGSDGYTKVASKSFTSEEFNSRVLVADSEAGWDYSIIDLDLPEFKDIPSLKLKESNDIQIGNSIALLGFQFEQENLSIHTGTLSSKFEKNKVKYLQLDASVNHGNSGGPLILPETGEVIGIVTRKATGLTQQFNEVIQSFNQNIQVIQAAQAGGSITFLGVNPLETFLITQAQLQKVAVEIQRSANVGIGYAYELDKIWRFLNSQNFDN